jgi:transposase
MAHYVGLDVSMEETKVHTLDEQGRCVWRGRCASDPVALERVLREHASQAVRIGLETGPLTTWLWTELTTAGLPMVCLDARKAKRVLDMKINKTDANDAEGLAHLVRSGWYGEVRVKSPEAMLMRSLLGARTHLMGLVTGLSNEIRGLMKTFGLVVPKGGGRAFDANVRRLVDGRPEVAAIILPLLNAWQAVRGRAAELDRHLLAKARANRDCRRLMTVPGVGAVVAASFVAAVEAPENFRRSRDVGAWLGLTPRRYQSGEVDREGHISRRGDAALRTLLYEAATILLTRVRAESSLRAWGMGLRARLGFKRAAVALARKLAVALARKLAVVLHAMWKAGADFDATASTAAA